MKYFGKKFIFSVSFLALAAVAFFLKYYIVAAFLCWPAFALNGMEITSYASVFQFINFRLHTVFLGFITDTTLGETYYPFTIALFLTSFAGTFRLEFFKPFGLTQYYWVEIMGIAGQYGVYLYANLQHPGDWRGWILPVFPMAFMTFIGYHIILDAIRLNKKGASKLNAESGQKAIDFSLPDNKGGMVKLSDYKDKNHVLLLFLRGDWCPSCHIMTRIYEKNREKFAEKNVVTLGISPDDSNVNAEMISRLGLQNILLTDSDQTVTKQYGGRFFTSPRATYAEGIPLPASVLVDKSGIIRYVSSPGKANEFLDPSHIFPIVAALN